MFLVVARPLVFRDQIGKHAKSIGVRPSLGKILRATEPGQLVTGGYRARMGEDATADLPELVDLLPRHSASQSEKLPSSRSSR
jgi:hypothetical protein